MTCNKFSELFFLEENQKELLEHILQCRECRYEYDKMQRTEQILKEAKPYFLRQKKRKGYLKAVACIGLFLVLSFGLLQNNFLNMYNGNNIANLTTSNSYTSDAGMPIDEYGLLDID